MREAKAEIQDTNFLDDLQNLVAELGTGNDKRAYGKFVQTRNLALADSQEELDAMYRHDWLSRKVVDIVPDDMTREWRSFTGDDDPERIKIYKEEEDRLQLRNRFNLAHKWARLYGGAMIIMSIDDGLDPVEPLDINRIGPGDLKHIQVVDKYQVPRGAEVIETNPLLPTFGQPEKYRFSETTVEIHNSRTIRFDGSVVPYKQYKRNGYWHDPIMASVYNSLVNYNGTVDGSASMVYDTNVDVVKVKGLMTYLQSDEGEAVLRKRFSLAKLLKSFNQMLLLDQEEDYHTNSNTFSGLPELIDRFFQILSAATDIPATRLLGTSASGMNATGEGDLKNYYDMISAKQVDIYKPRLDYFDEIMARSLGEEPENLEYEFNSLFQMTEAQQADIDLKNSQRDATYMDRGVVTEAQVAKELKQKGTYTNIDDEYINELEEMMVERQEAESEPIGTLQSGQQQQENPQENEEGNGGQTT